MNSDKFRAGVGAIIVNDAGKVLAFRRKNSDDAWQLPQGGLDKSEQALDGIVREVFEETGLADGELQLIAEHPLWLAYEFPEDISASMHFRGQVHKWFLFRLGAAYSDSHLARSTDEEFDAWSWLTIEELCEKTVPFKVKIYKALKQEFTEYLA